MQLTVQKPKPFTKQRRVYGGAVYKIASDRDHTVQTAQGNRFNASAGDLVMDVFDSKTRDGLGPFYLTGRARGVLGPFLAESWFAPVETMLLPVELWMKTYDETALIEHIVGAVSSYDVVGFAFNMPVTKQNFPAAFNRFMQLFGRWPKDRPIEERRAHVFGVARGFDKSGGQVQIGPRVDHEMSAKVGHENGLIVPLVLTALGIDPDDPLLRA